MRSDEPESGPEEEPTAVRETAQDFALKRTVLDIGEADAAELVRLRQSSTDHGTPKVNDLAQLLDALREQRLAQMREKTGKTTLRSLDPNEIAEPLASDHGEAGGDSQKPTRSVRSTGISESLPPQAARARPWAWLIAGMLVGGLLLAAGFALDAYLDRAVLSDRITLDLQVEPAGARVTSAEGSLPARGMVTLPCRGPTAIAIEAQGHVTERYELSCGATVVIRVRLQPEP